MPEAKRDRVSNSRLVKRIPRRQSNYLGLKGFGKEGIQAGEGKWCPIGLKLRGSTAGSANMSLESAHGKDGS